MDAIYVMILGLLAFLFVVYLFSHVSYKCKCKCKVRALGAHFPPENATDVRAAGYSYDEETGFPTRPKIAKGDNFALSYLNEQVAAQPFAQSGGRSAAPASLQLTQQTPASIGALDNSGTAEPTTSVSTVLNGSYKCGYGKCGKIFP